MFLHIPFFKLKFYFYAAQRTFHGFIADRFRSTECPRHDVVVDGAFSVRTAFVPKAYCMPLSRNFNCQFHAETMVSSTLSLAVHPKTLLALSGLAHTFSISPSRRPTIL